MHLNKYILNLITYINKISIIDKKTQSFYTYYGDDMGIFSRLFNLNVKTIEEEQGVNQEIKPQTPQISSDCSFAMMVEDVFSITGRGTVVTGKISKGTVTVGDTVMFNGIATTVNGIEMFRKTLDTASEGDNVGILLDKIDRNQISRGDIITK